MRSARNTTSTKHLTKSEHEELALFRYELRKFLHFSERAAKSAGLMPQQHQALLAIKGYPGRDSITVGELAERLQIRPHSAVGLVDRLVASELVVREAASDDRRQVYIRLSKAGEEVLARLSSVHRSELRRISIGLIMILQKLAREEEA